MKYAFFGTPKFAAMVLERLIESGITPTVLVCNPDKSVGRKKIMTPPPTKLLVESKTNKERLRNIRIYQPNSKEELLESSEGIFDGVDFGIVAAYAQIIQKEVIETPRLGIIGVHPSLLPELRGATPIQTAILNGCEKTGVTLFMLDEKVDHGPILASKSMSMDDRIGYEELEKRLADLAGGLLIETLPRFVTGKISPVAQDESRATYTKKFITEDAYIDEGLIKEAEKSGSGATDILRKIKALNPEPGAYTVINEKRTKLLDAEIVEGKLKLLETQKEGGVPVRG